MYVAQSVEPIVGGVDTHHAEPMALRTNMSPDYALYCRPQCNGTMLEQCWPGVSQSLSNRDDYALGQCALLPLQQRRAWSRNKLVEATTQLPARDDRARYTLCSMLGRERLSLPCSTCQ